MYKLNGLRVKLRSQIFLWLMLAGLLPLLLLLAASIFYGERFYQNRVDAELTSELNRIASLLDDRLRERGKLLQSIHRSPVLARFAESFGEVLQAQYVTTTFTQHKNELENYLLDLQPLIPVDSVIRIVDQAGRTLSKIRFGATTQISLESLPPYRILEDEPDESLAVRLAFLPLDSVSHMRFPGSEKDFSPQRRLPLLDAVLPVQAEKHRIYLVYSSQGQQLDHAMDLAPRLRQSELLILESVPDHSVELLVDDALGRQFMTALPAQPVTTAMQSVLAQAETVPEGAFQNTDGFRYVFTEYLPYPDQLISWVLAARISPDLLAADLRLLRKGLIAMAVVTLLVGLLLSGWVARHLAKPICRLAENIKAYGRGEMQAPTIPSSIQEVNQVQQSFAGMADTLKQTEQQLLQSAKMASIGEMAAGIGHELNNPLNNMLSLGKLLQRNEALDDNGQKDVDALLEETRRASKIVQGILNFARQTPLQYEQFDLGEFLENCRRRVADLAAEKQVKIQIEFAETILMEADHGQLEQVMVNLLMNAIQASAASSAVEIHAEKNTGQVIIRVKDEGAGLTEIAKTKLFEPFFTTKAVGEGSGLGLSISLGIVESHGGELTIENHPAGGVVAEIKIPEKHA